MTQAINPQKPAVMHYNADFRFMQHSLAEKFGKVVLSEVRICPEYSESELVLESDKGAGGSFSLRILGFSDHYEAVKEMTKCLDETYAVAVDDVFARPVAGREKGQLHIVNARSGKGEKSLWVVGNAFISISSLVPSGLGNIEEYIDHVNGHVISEQV